jgi:glycerol-3-phosphate acyltransferase PlsX
LVDRVRDVHAIIASALTTVALDAMGADGGVAPLVHGAAQLSREKTQLTMVLVGDEPAIEKALAEEAHDASRLRIVHAPAHVGMSDKPSEALDNNPDCSVLTAARLVAEGEADALVSAGNTGALILAASRTFERVPGVRRVGLAAVYPTMKPHGPHEDPFALILDVGATLRCTAEELIAFAVMGSAYSRVISDIERPRVALLSNGSESGKGTPEIVEAHARLRDTSAVAFAGNVEGLDIPRGSVDVIVCEGFVGNIVLKMLEGVSEVAKDLARTAYGSGLRYKIGLGMLASGIRKIKGLTDWKSYGGAPIVGFDHTIIKAHGRSNARAVRNALKVAAKTVERKLTSEIRAGMPADPGPS